MHFQIGRVTDLAWIAQRILVNIYLRFIRAKTMARFNCLPA